MKENNNSALPAPQEARDKYLPIIKMRLREYLAEKGWSAVDLAAKIGMKQGSVRNWKSDNNKEGPGLYHLLAIQDVLGRDIKWFLICGLKPADGIKNSDDPEDREAFFARGRAAMKKWTEEHPGQLGQEMRQKVSACPQCGAPIYSDGRWSGDTPPQNVFTCDCRRSE